jgi:predicted MPP superfamily phosphohydrolase
MFKIFQLSDIHFIEDADLDVDTELRDAVIRFASKVRGDFGEIDAIAVTGDIAYSGKTEEYARAGNFLRNLGSALGTPRIFVIPGNHDIFLPATNNADQRHWRSQPRRKSISAAERDRSLTQLLADAKSANGLMEPLQNYLDFASTYSCGFKAQPPLWRSDPISLGSQYAVRFYGLTSVLVSDGNDDVDGLILGGVQSSLVARTEDIVNISLCHHPYEFLLDEDLEKKFDRRCPIHVTGHKHRHQLRPTHAGVHVMAGALQPDRRDPKWESRLNLITLEVTDGESPQLAIDVYPAIWQVEIDDYAFEPDAPEEYRKPLASTPPALPSETMRIEADLVRLQERLATLSAGDRFKAGSAARLDLRVIAALPGSENVAAIIQQATERRALAELWDEVERLHGNQTTDRPNPFTDQDAN